MARSSRWSSADRAKLLKDVQDGIAEQDIRRKFTTTAKSGGTRDMTSVEFAQQLKQAMVEAGIIKQSKPGQLTKNTYLVTSSGRLNIPDFQAVTGFNSGSAFTLETPRGRSKAWRLVPVE